MRAVSKADLEYSYLYKLCTGRAVCRRTVTFVLLEGPYSVLPSVLGK